MIKPLETNLEIRDYFVYSSKSHQGNRLYYAKLTLLFPLELCDRIKASFEEVVNIKKTCVFHGTCPVI